MKKRDSVTVGQVDPVKNVHKKDDGEGVLENVESFLSREECVP